MIKVCGLTTPDAVDAALAGGATHLGFVFDARSPRDIDPLMAAELAGMARGPARRLRPRGGRGRPRRRPAGPAGGEVRPDFIQLHGRETPERVAEIRARTGRGVIKALPVAGRRTSTRRRVRGRRRPSDVRRQGADGERAGGTGAASTGGCSRAAFAKPWFLAGGLTADTWRARSGHGAPRASTCPLAWRARRA
jgi:phosphoribosylanthranilate isomerase